MAVRNYRVRFFDGRETTVTAEIVRMDDSRVKFVNLGVGAEAPWLEAVYPAREVRSIETESVQEDHVTVIDVGLGDMVEVMLPR